MRLSTFDWVVVALIIIGGINWGLIGFFEFDLVAAIFGSFSRVIYAIVGIAAVYYLYWMNKRAMHR